MCYRKLLYTLVDVRRVTKGASEYIPRAGVSDLEVSASASGSWAAHAISDASTKSIICTLKWGIAAQLRPKLRDRTYRLSPCGAHLGRTDHQRRKVHPTCWPDGSQRPPDSASLSDAPVATITSISRVVCADSDLLA